MLQEEVQKLIEHFVLPEESAKVRAKTAGLRMIPGGKK